MFFFCSNSTFINKFIVLKLWSQRQQTVYNTIVSFTLQSKKISIVTGDGNLVPSFEILLTRKQSKSINLQYNEVGFWRAKIWTISPLKIDGNKNKITQNPNLVTVQDLIRKILLISALLYQNCSLVSKSSKELLHIKNSKRFFNTYSLRKRGSERVLKLSLGWDLAGSNLERFSKGLQITL